jgi:hypothetical protein
VPARKRSPEPKPPKNKSGEPREVPKDVAKKQLGDYSIDEFGEALHKATQRVVDPSEHDPGSSRR